MKWALRFLTGIFCVGIAIGLIKTQLLPAANSLALAKMVKLGHYDYVDELITSENFPVEIERFKTSGLIRVHFESTVSTDEIFSYLLHNNLRPAIMEELLAYGAGYPNRQLEHPIFALGTVRKNSKNVSFVPALDSLDAQRGLYLTPLQGEWTERCYFLVVRK